MSTIQHPCVTYMLPNVVEFLAQHPLTATDSTSIEQWVRDCEASWAVLASTFLTEEESAYGASLLSTCLSATRDLARLVAFKSYSAPASWPIDERRRHLEALVNRPQVEQRTEAWYIEAASLITASQLGTLFKSPRTRALLVVEKATGAVDTSSRRTVVLTEEMNPFTWGIRFEPCVKQLYQVLTGTQVAELGRLRHRSDPQLAASPDGLVVKGPDQRLARLVEFKAPISRPILNVIPDDYLMQMQLQMEVGDVEECDYLEVKFQSAYQGRPCPEKPETAPYWGWIHIIGKEDGTLDRYEYSPLKDDAWRPTLETDEVLVDSIPWWTETWYLTTVGRSRTWFQNIQPALKSFWADVALAKEGKFTVPAPRQKANKQVCKFVEDSDETKGDQPDQALVSESA